MKTHRYVRFAVGFLVAMAFVVVAGVLPSDAQARGGGGGFHGGGGGGRGFHGGGGRGFHGSGFHGQGFHSRSFQHGGFQHGGFHNGGFHHRPFIGHRGSRVFFGFGVGLPLFYPYGYGYAYGYPYYGYPYYGYGYPYSPPVVVESAPPVYAQPDVQPQQYWYYCRESQSYYPSVSDCPEGWIQVAPQSQ